MIQFSLKPSTNISLYNQTSMAINAGCQWIELDPADADNETLDAIINDCREAGVILVFHHNDAKLEEKRVHGVKLSTNDIEPLSLRDRLGGHPIIGVEVATDVELYPLKRADVDYVQLSDYPTHVTLQEVKALNDRMAQQGITFPIVVEGLIKEEDIKPLIEAGASGFNINIDSLKGPEYGPSLEKFISLTL